MISSVAGFSTPDRRRRAGSTQFAIINHMAGEAVRLGALGGNSALERILGVHPYLATHSDFI
jgi:hypothetical protein